MTYLTLFHCMYLINFLTPGLILSYCTYAVLSHFNLNPYWYLMASVPAALFGGLNPILLTFFCYITDITNSENRAWHLACLETTFFTGIFTGILLGPVIFKFFGYVAVFLLSGFFSLFALLYTIFCVKETIYNDNEVSTVLCNIFTVF